MSEGVDPLKDPIEDAREYVMSIMQDCYGKMGGNDSEHDELQGLIDQLLEGEITPDEAKRLANEVFERKNPYH
jgi:hypothetical protein